MNRRYFFWVLLITVCSALLIIYSMWKTPLVPARSSEKLTPYPHAPFKSYLSGVGVVEAGSDNISIGAPVNRIVETVPVKVGQEVKKGDILFTLENQDLLADLASRQAAYAIAQARLQKLEALPRSEDLAAAEASVRSVQIELEEAKSLYQRVQGLQNSKAISLQQINRRQFDYEKAEARFQEAEANLDKIKAGTWKPDLEIAKLEIEQSKAEVRRVQADIQNTIIRSPIDGKVLQIKIHEGELPVNTNRAIPPMIVGNIEEIYLKVSINQFDAPYFHPNAKAVAYLRGNGRVKFDLQFVRLEPYLVNKQNLTNEITDQVDTRVLQVIYLIQNKDYNIFVGQQMDVFIQAEFPS